MDAVQITNLWKFGDRRPELASAIRGLVRRVGYTDAFEVLIEVGLDPAQYEDLEKWAQDELKARKCRAFHNRMCSRHYG